MYLKFFSFPIRHSALAAFLGAVLFAPALHAATIAVTTTDDIIAVDGQCSLREAVTAANTNMPFSDCPMGETLPVIDVIELPAGTYTLNLEPIGEDANLGGDLDVLEAVTVRGLGDDFIWWDDDATPEVETLDVFGDPDGFPRIFAEADLPDVVVEMGLGKPTTPGDGDRIFHIFDPAPGKSARGTGPTPEVTFENLGIVRGEAFCQAAGFCRPGGAGIDHRSSAGLTLRRVALFENRASCAGAGCGTSTTAAAVYAESTGDLRILESVIASTRAVCGDTDCNTGRIIYQDVSGASAIALFELDQSLVTANETFCSASGCNADEVIQVDAGAQRIHQSVITGNALACEAAGLECGTDELLRLTAQFPVPCTDATCFRELSDVEISANSVRCDGFECDTDEILDADEVFDQTYARIRFQDNEQHCAGFGCDIDEIADFREGSGSGASFSLSDAEFLDNAHLCEGTECDADQALLLSGQGLATVSNLTVREESRCIGRRCDPSTLVDMEDVADIDGLSIIDSEVSCTGDDCFTRPLLTITAESPLAVELNGLVITGSVANCTGVNCGFGDELDPGFIGYGGIVSLISRGEPAALFTLDKATISGNVTSARGTLATNAVLTITDSSLRGNIATDGGGIFNGRQATSSAFKPGELRLVNTILDGNTAGGPELRGVGSQGGGLFNPAGATLYLQGGAITNNAASVGGGIWNGGTIALRQSTVIENNTPDDCLDDGGTGCELLFNDGFESGDTTAWSLAHCSLAMTKKYGRLPRNPQMTASILKSVVHHSA